MAAWHLGAVVFLFRWIFRDPKVDMRFLALGVFLPDVLDLAVVTAIGGESGELWSHSLLAPSLVAIAVLAATRRGRRRRAWMALVVAWLFHLLIDGMWTDTEVFLWPLFGVDLTGASVSFWAGAWERATSDIWRWVLEAVGIAYLWWLSLSARLTLTDRRRVLLRTGRISDEPTPDYGC